MSAPTTSRIETTRAALITAIEGITAGADYRSTVATVSPRLLDPKSVTQWPTVCVLFPREIWKAYDTAKLVWQSRITVIILGYCRGSQVDALIHDLRRVLAGIALSSVNDATNKWIIECSKDTEGIIFSRADLLPPSDVTIVGTTFIIQLNSQTATF